MLKEKYQDLKENKSFLVYVCIDLISDLKQTYDSVSNVNDQDCRIG